MAGDAEGWNKTGHIFLVADGMGGHAVGEKASAKAAGEIPHTYRKYAEEGAASAIRRAFQEVNASINAVGQENPEFRGLGTTGSALVLRPEGAWLGHVGDSRVYRIRSGHVEQLTYDHSLQWELARREGVRPEDLPDIKKNVIVRSLGPDPLVEVDVEGPHPIDPGDAFLLCSDGLTNLVEDDELGAIVESMSAEEGAKLLVELANLRGGPDNITVLIVKVGDISPPPGVPRVGKLKTAWTAWMDRVPWPLTVMMLGLFLAVAFVVAITQELPGQVLLFLAAGGALGVGLYGLIRDSLKPKPPPPPKEEPRELHVYRRLSCELGKSIVERFSQFGEQLRQHSQERGWNPDAEAFEQHHGHARELAEKDQLRDAFREECRGIQILANCFNKNRKKEEVFQPKWDIVAS